MNLLMTDRAVLESSRAQIMERGRNVAKQLPWRRTRAYIRVTFKTDKAHLIPGQHSGIHRSMGIMTGATSFETHRCVFKREGSALIGVTA